MSGSRSKYRLAAWFCLPPPTPPPPCTRGRGPARWAPEAFQGSAQGAERASPAKSMFAAWLNVVRAPVAVAPEGDKIMTIASEINGRSQRNHVPPNRGASEYFFLEKSHISVPIIFIWQRCLQWYSSHFNSIISNLKNLKIIVNSFKYNSLKI